jgi:hypothetical protein
MKGCYHLMLQLRIRRVQEHPISLGAAAVGYQYHNLSVFTITWRRYEKINETPRRNLKK